MKLSQIFNAPFFVAVVALIVIIVQSFTGFFIAPEIQIGILAGIGVLVRVFTGRDLFGETPEAPVITPGSNTKLLWQSKMFWASVVAIIAVPLDAIFGFKISPDVMLQIFVTIQFLLSIITHKPVTLT